MPMDADSTSSDESPHETSTGAMGDISTWADQAVTAYLADFENRIFSGDCFELVSRLPGEGINLVFTSPPYANQRKNQYGGVSEADYPAWTVKWMSEVYRALKPRGNVAMVIRPHVHNWEISDYVLRTRLALREWGWIEPDEMIWMKPDGPALGNKYFHGEVGNRFFGFRKTGNRTVIPRRTVVRATTSASAGFPPKVKEIGLRA